MILFLIILAAIVAVLYKSYGKTIFWIAAIVAAIYIFWIQGHKEKKELLKKEESVMTFMKADKEMLNLIKSLPLESKELSEKIYHFYDLYLECFTTSPSKFDILTDTRRDILNHLSTSIIKEDIVIPDHIIIGFSDCLWKYIKAISRKYDLQFAYPIAYNTMDPRDLH